jgi:hypothetical protein
MASTGMILMVGEYHQTSGLYVPLNRLNIVIDEVVLLFDSVSMLGKYPDDIIISSYTYTKG